MISDGSLLWLEDIEVEESLNWVNKKIKRPMTELECQNIIILFLKKQKNYNK